MAGMIRISPDALRAAAERYMMVNATIEEAGARLKALASQLDASWDGGASRAALDKIQDLIVAVGDAAETSSGTSSMLKGVAQAFESFDAGNSSVIAPWSGVIDMLGRITLRCPPGGIGGILRALYHFDGSMRIEPDAVRAVAYGCKVVADDLREAAQEIIAQADGLASQWEGNAYNRFREQSNDIRASFMQIADHIDEFASETIESANRYEELDNTFFA